MNKPSPPGMPGQRANGETGPANAAFARINGGMVQGEGHSKRQGEFWPTGAAMRHGPPDPASGLAVKAARQCRWPQPPSKLDAMPVTAALPRGDRPVPAPRAIAVRTKEAAQVS